MSLQTVRGTHDLLPEENALQRYIVEKARQRVGYYGFLEMSTPIFEFSDVFSRTLGEASDIVNKEMYTFTDRGGDSLTLRPEGTAGIARAVISGGLAQNLPLKFFYQGPMFRYERPQKGRLRQFHQIGVELLGVTSPVADLECIAAGYGLMNDLNILPLVTLELNTVGDFESRKGFTEKLVSYLRLYEKDLSADSQKRLQMNPLRILDSKDPKDQEIISGAPQIRDTLSVDAGRFFDSVLEGLSRMKIPFQINPRLVRGLDYYTHCVFEFRTQSLGAQDALLAGGRYDGLIQSMGGPDIPGIGWAAGIERLALLTKEFPLGARPVALIPLGDAGESLALELAETLRRQNHYVEITYSGNLSKRMKKANNMNSRFAIILGDNEVQSKAASVKDLDSGEQRTVAFSDLPTFLKV